MKYKEDSKETRDWRVRCSPFPRRKRLFMLSAKDCSHYRWRASVSTHRAVWRPRVGLWYLLAIHAVGLFCQMRHLQICRYSVCTDVQMLKWMTRSLLYKLLQTHVFKKLHLLLYLTLSELSCDVEWKDHTHLIEKELIAGLLPACKVLLVSSLIWASPVGNVEAIGLGGGGCKMSTNFLLHHLWKVFHLALYMQIVEVFWMSVRCWWPEKSIPASGADYAQ